MSEIIPTSSPETVLAHEICSSTLIGVRKDPKDRFFKGGNCFTMSTGDKEVKIVNFGYENLKLLLKEGAITLPVKIHLLSPHVAVIHDERIPNDAYRKDFCEVCCPEGLLPLPQRLRFWREELTGFRTRIRHPDGSTSISYNHDKKCV